MEEDAPIMFVVDANGEVWARQCRRFSDIPTNIFVNRFGEKVHYDHLDAPLSVEGRTIRSHDLDVSR